MQSIASVVLADLRARQIQQTLGGPTQHERLLKCTPMKKRERRNQSTALFVPSSSCGPVEPTGTFLCASICPDDLREDPHHPGTFATSLRVWRGSYPVYAFRHRRSRSQTRSSARRHSFEQNLCRGDLLVCRNCS